MIRRAILALLAAAPSDAPDTGFVIAQEQWVYRASKAAELPHVLAGREVRLIRALGCEKHYGCRVNAEELIALSPRAIPMLVWGSHHVDPEIAARSTALLNKIARCRHCRGAGKCVGAPGTSGYRRELLCTPCWSTYWASDTREWGDGTCLACGGSGDGDYAAVGRN